MCLLTELLYVYIISITIPAKPLTFEHAQIGGLLIYGGKHEL